MTTDFSSGSRQVVHGKDISNITPGNYADPIQNGGVAYQTYREALSLIRFALLKTTQMEAYDFLADIYKKAPIRLQPVFVMALISTLTSFNFSQLMNETDKRNEA